MMGKLHVRWHTIYLFFKQKTAYEVRISDWSSDVCSSDLHLLQYLVEAPRSRARQPIPVQHDRAVHRLAGDFAEPAAGDDDGAVLRGRGRSKQGERQETQTQHAPAFFGRGHAC